MTPVCFAGMLQPKNNGPLYDATVPGPRMADGIGEIRATRRYLILHISQRPGRGWVQGYFSPCEY